MLSFNFTIFKQNCKLSKHSKFKTDTSDMFDSDFKADIPEICNWEQILTKRLLPSTTAP